SFIAVSIMPADKTVLDYTKEGYQDYLTEYYTESFGQPVRITVDSFRLKQIDGSDGLRATYFLETDGIWFFMLNVIAVTPAGNFELLFADATNDNGWTDDFNLSSRTIDIVWSDEIDGPDYSIYQLCDNGTGLTVRMGNDMVYQNLEGMTMCYYGDNCLMTGLKEGYADLSAVGLDPENMSLEDYAAVIEQNHALSEAFEPDSYGNLAVTYGNNVDGIDLFYYSTVRKGTDAFWLVSFACLDEQRETWLPLFELWGNSIAVQ
ncbi:MAG: hypothetical protein Q4C13_05380, partial [Clostridia bacterium]|nr:hypothetical protein [Clostridia bacterium]